MPRRPDLFIVGAPKSGTTSLYEYLRGHPDVFMSSVKEPMYFSPDVYRSHGKDTTGIGHRFVFGRDDERYLALFAEATDEKRVGEASTHYLSSPSAPSLIRGFEPDARIVCILRDPVEMTYAWHGERVYRGVEARPTFDLSLIQSGSKYLEIGRYGTQLTRWFEEFGRERVHAVVFDDFIDNTAHEFRGVLDFLEVDPDYQPPSFEAHNAFTDKSRLVPLLHTRPARSAAAVVRRLAGHGCSRRLSRGLRSLPVVNSRDERPPLGREVRSRLEEAYADEIVLAGKLLGRDLRSLWLGPQTSERAAEASPA